MYYSYSKNWNVYFTKMLGGDLGILSSVLEKTSCREAGMMNNTKRVLSLWFYLFSYIRASVNPAHFYERHTSVYR